MNLRNIFIVTLILVFLFPSISLSMDLEKYLSVDEMMDSIQTEPEKWLITHSYAIFFGNHKLVKYAKQSLFPSSSDTAKIVIYLNLYKNLAKLEKPDGLWYEGSDLKKIIKTIKLYKYNEYKKELGIKDKTTVIIKEVEKDPHWLEKLF